MHITSFTPIRTIMPFRLNGYSRGNDSICHLEIISLPAFFFILPFRPLTYCYWHNHFNIPILTSLTKRMEMDFCYACNKTRSKLENGRNCISKNAQ